MAINKIILNNETLIDLSNDTVSESDVAAGKTFHKADGSSAVGTATTGGSSSGGDCTLPHVIEVDTLPDGEAVDVNAVYFCDGKYYKYGLQFQDIVMTDGETTTGYIELFLQFGYTATTNVIPTQATDGVLESDLDNGILHFYYIVDEQDNPIFLYSDGAWLPFTSVMNDDTVSYGGTITDASEATDTSCYYVLGDVGWTCYILPEGALTITEEGTFDVTFKKLVVVDMPEQTSAVVVHTVADLPNTSVCGSIAIVLEG